MLPLKDRKAQVVVYSWFLQSVPSAFLTVHLSQIKRGLNMKELKAVREILEANPNTILPEELYPMLFFYYSQTQTPLRGNVYNTLKNWHGVSTLTKEWVKHNADLVITKLNHHLNQLHVSSIEFHLQSLYSALALSDLLLNE